MIFINKKHNGLKRRTTSEFIEIARSVHGKKYDYAKTEYTGNCKKLTITCRVHGDFEQFANGHLQGKNCIKCAKESAKGVYTRTQITTDEFITKAKEVHGDTFIYDKTAFVKMRLKVTITCREHGEFNQEAFSHLKGHGCRKCISTKRSKVADAWLDSLNIAEEHREAYIPEYPSRSLDAYVAETNTVYQFHGNYWHGNLKMFSADEVNAHIGKTMGELNKRTNEWDQKIRDLNYNLVVMWESDWNDQKSLIVND